MLTYPLDPDLVLRKRKSLKREMSGGPGLLPLRIAVLGGVTTSEIIASLEVLLLNRGIQAEFLESDYNKFYEDAVLDSSQLVEFSPDVVYICTSSHNLRSLPAPLAAEQDVEQHLESELARFRQVWSAISAKLPTATLLQNNFEPLPVRPLGSLEGTAVYGRGAFVQALNRALAIESQRNPKLKIVDQHQVAAQYGISRWFSATHWHGYKMAQTPESAVYLANAISSLIAALYGRAKKCLVLDLDNTLWGGVIGDDGVERIQLGRETPVAEAYTAFQQYCKGLQQRGVILAVCSKNEESNARLGFEHPDSVLKLTDFSAFRANWDSKDINIRSLAEELNIGLDSFVFMDDNPAERALVSAQLRMVAVPDIGSDVSLYPEILDEAGYFEAAALSAEDAERTRLYAANAERREMEQGFANYGEYLQSLEMVAEIREFSPVYLERISQLTNKSNQFNLTTRRYTRTEMEAFAARPDCIPLYGRLADRFGDNGLVTVVMGFVKGDTVDIDLWLMSCRVLKRDMEIAMLDELVSRARAKGAVRLLGTFLRTSKNGMVADFYQKLGFTCVDQAEDGSRSSWELPIQDYEPRNRYIVVKDIQ
jgi:FkbH-like protein